MSTPDFEQIAQAVLVNGNVDTMRQKNAPPKVYQCIAYCLPIGFASDIDATSPQVNAGHKPLAGRSSLGQAQITDHASEALPRQTSTV